jgi:hypothetical protein
MPVKSIDSFENILDLKCAMNRGLSTLKVIFIIGIACAICKTSNSFQKISKSMARAEKIAVACVTDLHCNDQIYPKIGVRVKELCETNDAVILVVNGDIFTKYDPWNVSVIDRKGMGKGAYAFHENHFFSPGGLADFFINLMGDNSKIDVVFNIGNHEVIFKYAHLFARFLKKIRDRVGERFHVVSNLKAKKPDVPMGDGEPRDGLVEFIKPFARVRGIIFVGYCTKKILKDTVCKGKSLYGYAKDHFYDLEKTMDAHDQVFIGNTRNAVKNRMNSSVLFLLSHEKPKKFNKVWKKMEEDSQNNGNYLSTMKQKMIVLGHSHGDNNYNISNATVIAPRALGLGMKIVELNLMNDSSLPGADASACFSPQTTPLSTSFPAIITPAPPLSSSSSNHFPAVNKKNTNTKKSKKGGKRTGRRKNLRGKIRGKIGKRKKSKKGRKCVGRRKNLRRKIRKKYRKIGKKKSPKNQKKKR